MYCNIFLSFFFFAALNKKRKMEAETVLSLKQQLKEAENERRKAAQYGLHLLESQSEIQNQLDQTRCELTEKTEVMTAFSSPSSKPELFVLTVF